MHEESNGGGDVRENSSGESSAGTSSVLRGHGATVREETIEGTDEHQEGVGELTKL